MYGCNGHRIDSCLAKEVSNRETSPVISQRAASMDVGEGPLPHSSKLHKGCTTGIVFASESGGIEVVDRFGFWMLAKKSRCISPRSAGTPLAVKSIDLAVSNNHGQTSSSI